MNISHISFLSFSSLIKLSNSPSFSVLASNSDWMSNLPKRLLNAPLRGIAVPGSHNSASYSLNMTDELAPGIPDEVSCSPLDPGTPM